MMPFLTEEKAISFLLILSRLSGMFVAAPIFSAKNIPTKYKILFSLVLSAILFPSITPLPEPPKTIPALIILTIGQAIFGFFLGSCISLILTSLQMAGSIMDFQIGFSMSTIVDPQTKSPTTLISRWYYYLAGMIFLGINGHHWLFLGIINSFRAVPLDTLVLSPRFIEYYIRSFSNILTIAFHVAVPIMTAIILIDMIMGFIGKIAPQMNILIVGFPFKIGLGIILLSVMTPATIGFFVRYLNTLQRPLMKMFYL